MKENIKIAVLGVVAFLLAIQVGVLSDLQNSQKESSKQLASIAQVQNSQTPKEIQDQINANGYQAVFLTDKSTYFGKLKEMNPNFFSLTDVFYLKEGGGSLIKLSNELHGPKDYMYIPKSQVLFVENLKDDGQVVKAIKSYKP
ncbi:MAG TPA: hypothetical protein VLG37_05340 [Candidatus Saccharimonadales bacterium]|nr:hypothetical protein [Candidatus Saccharimonadales bacterium]